MATMTKTPLGTISAHRWDNGISAGLYGKENFISIEYNELTKNIELIINDDKLKEQNIVVKYVSNEEFFNI